MGGDDIDGDELATSAAAVDGEVFATGSAAWNGDRLDDASGFEGAHGTISADGSIATYQTSTVGQSGRYTFSGTAGQYFTMQTSAGAGLPTSITVTVYQPSGAIIGSANLYSNTDTKINLGALPASGTYTVTVIPNGVTTGTVNLRLVAYNTGALTVDNSAPVTLSIAQNGRYTFTGNAADFLGLGVTALTVTPSAGSVLFNVYKPDGTSMWSTSTSLSTSWQLPQLPVSGTYVLSLQPPGTASASMTLVFSGALTGTISTDGATTTYQTTMVGQAGRYIFTGTTGQYFTMQATAGAGLTSSISVTVYQPSGGSIGSATLYGNTDTKIDLGALPAAGTYTVTVIPYGVTTGTVNVRLVPHDTGTITIGNSTSVMLGAAQNARYTFSGNADDLLNLAASGVTTTPAGKYVYLYLYKPDGSQLWSNSTYSSGTWQLPQLPTTGTYALIVRPNGTAAATLTVQLTAR